MQQESKIYKVGNFSLRLREELKGCDWDLYTRGSKLLDDIQKKKMSLNVEEKVIEVKVGDFSNDEYLEFAAMGFVDISGKEVTKEICSEMGLKDSLNGFMNFFLNLIELMALQSDSMNLTGKLEKYAKILQN